MTDNDHIENFDKVDYEELLILVAVKDYMRITQVSSSDFVEEIYRLASEAVFNYSEDITTSIKKLS